MRMYDKPSLSISEQIQRLIQRGMAIPDRARASHYLTHISYYRLSGYWRLFEDGTAAEDHQFKAGTHFDKVLQLYIFDRELRLLVMDAIERIEISLRSQWGHLLAQAYGPHAHLDPSNFCSSADHAECLAALVRDIKKSHETFIKHYLETYDKPDLPPVWAVCKIMSLGQLSRWFSIIRTPALRQQIAATYQMDERILASFLHHLTTVRNCCAHHSRLWNRRFTVKMQLPEKKPAGLIVNFNKTADRYVYNTLAMLAYLMDIINPGHHWKRRLSELLERHPEVWPRSMGFPDNWRDLPLWRGKV
ncbi:MAG TPA: Abi family protein [Geobacteraceae bacterium]